MRYPFYHSRLNLEFGTIRTILLVMLLCSPGLLSGQHPQTAEADQAALTLLEELQQVLPYTLAYSEAVLKYLPDQPIQLEEGLGWRDHLRVVKEALQLDHRIINDQLILFPREQYLVSGYVYDLETGESLPGAHVLSANQQTGTTTNAAGYYQILLAAGQQELIFSYLGYQLQRHTLALDKTIQLDVRLASAIDLPTVTVVDASSTTNPQLSGQSSADQLPLSDLGSMPSIGAAMDVARYMHLIPGVITGGDGLGGIHVRGGNADQNLYLLEDIPVYNPFHLFGVSSIFSGSAIRQASLSTSFWEPATDGRLSSVLQVGMRDGHRTKQQLDASVSLLGSHLLIATPWAKRKGTLMLAGQLSHANGMIESYSQSQRQLDDNDGFFRPGFYDLYAKAMFQPGRNDKLVLNFYAGANTHLDVNRYDFGRLEDTLFTDQYRDEYDWGNLVVGLKWQHNLSGRAFLHVQAYHSRYQYQSANAYQEALFLNNRDQDGYFEISEFRSSIAESGLKANVDWLVNSKHRLQWGLSIAAHDYEPGIVAYGEDNAIMSVDIGRSLPRLPDRLFDRLDFTSRQALLHAQDDWQLNAGWRIKLGFSTLLFVNSPDQFFSFQPKLQIAKALKQSLVTLSLQRTVQPQHLIAATDQGLPSELWVPATALIPPQQSWQMEGRWQMQWSEYLMGQCALYYKQMTGLVSFRDSPGYLSYGPLDNIDASVWEEDVTTGDGTSWGIENSLTYQNEGVKARINYTFSISDRYFPGKNLDFIVPYDFQSPHSLNLSLSWRPGLRWNVASTWQMASGTRVNLIPGRYETYDNADFFLEEFSVPEGSLELLIMPMYHRWDVAVSYATRSDRKWKHQLKLSLLNLYNRENIIFPRIYRGEITDIRYAQGLPFIPSFSWQVQWN